jgi:hypothetical protein
MLDKEVSSSTDAPKDDDEDEKDEKVEVECAPSHSQKKPKRQGFTVIPFCSHSLIFI